MARIAVTGASGFIGRRLCSTLLARGDRVVAISRDPARAKPLLPAGADVIGWDPMSGSVPDFDRIAVDAIVHLAGESTGGRWNEAGKREIHQSRVVGTRNLVAALAASANRPRALISASAIGYYGDQGDRELDDDAAPGVGFLAQVCRDWEAEALRAEAFGPRVVRIRTGLVLGGDGGALKTMCTPYRLGLGGPMGGGRQWMSWIHLEDEVGLILHAVDHDEIRGSMNATAPEPVRNRAFARALGAALRRPAILPVPAVVLRLILGEASEMVLSSQRVLPARALATGYQFAYPSLEAALARCVGR